MTAKALMNTKSNAVRVGLLIVLQSLISFAAAAQVQAPPTGVVLGEDPLIRELRPPSQTMALEALALDAGYRLQVVYLVPSNRTAQPGAEETLQGFVMRTQQWFRDHMERLGYTSKTFTYESTEGGSAPKIHVVSVEQPDSYFHGEYVERWNKVLNRLSAAGFPIWQQGTLTLVIAEMHVQEADGRLLEASTFFGGAGTSVSGVAMVTGETLARLSESFLTDDRSYDGLVIPDIGPYPLVQNVSFAWFEGTTVSSISSSAQGGVMHELGHGVNLWHDFRNDRNFNGNLMGNGLRGLRGSLFPQLYPADDVGLSTGSAVLLDNSRFFNSDQSFTDHVAPAIQILTSETAMPARGLCELTYSAFDSNSILGGALLIRAGQVVADTRLDVAELVGTISTYDYTPGVQDDWNMVVIDRQGNRTVSPGVRIQCAPGYNRAPQPDVHVTTTKVGIAEEVRLDATASRDPDGNPSNLTVRWDLDGDGTFDTSPTTSKAHTTTYSQPGIYQVVAELTDEYGDSSVSVPIGIRVDRRDVLLEVDVASISGGVTVTASWSGIPAPTATDWIGLYRVGAANSEYIDWLYVSCSQTPGIPQASGSCPFLIPDQLAAGTYELRLLANDGFSNLAISNPLTLSTSTTLLVSPAVIPAGGTVIANWSGIPAPTATDWIGLYRVGAASSEYIDWLYVSCSQTPGIPQASGSCPFPIPDQLAAGTYELRLLANDGFSNLAISNPLTLSTSATLLVSPAVIPAGGTVIANWSGILAPTATDWIGLYRVGAANSEYIEWLYVSCSQAPGIPQASGSCPFPIPDQLAAGTYELRLLASDAFSVLAISNAFTVTTTAGHVAGIYHGRSLARFTAQH